MNANGFPVSLTLPMLTVLILAATPGNANEPRIDQWSAESAAREAQQAISGGDLYLYTSGGFVCSPKTHSRYRDLVRTLPAKPLACGCVITGQSMVQADYARTFNDLVLEYLSENPDAAAKNREPGNEAPGFKTLIDRLTRRR